MESPNKDTLEFSVNEPHVVYKTATGQFDFAPKKSGYHIGQNAFQGTCPNFQEAADLCDRLNLEMPTPGSDTIPKSKIGLP